MTKLFLKHQTSMPVAILTLFLLMVFAPVAFGKSESVIAVENGGKLVESVGNLPDWPEEDWNGANDGDLETWDGTVTVFNYGKSGVISKIREGLFRYGSLKVIPEAIARARSLNLM